MEKTHTAVENNIFQAAQMDSFTDEWHRKNAEAMGNAGIWLTDMMAFVPPALFGDLDKICRHQKTCSGGFPMDSEEDHQIARWSLSANILAPSSKGFANIAILSVGDLEVLYDDRPLSFGVSFHIRLDYSFGSEMKNEVLTSFVPTYIDHLREKTFLNDMVLYTVFNDAFNALPDFNSAIMDKVRSLLPDRHAQFIFDKAIRCSNNFRAAYENVQHTWNIKKYEEKKSQELYELSRRSSKSLANTAKRIELTKSFSKSRILGKIRKDVEQEAVDVEAKADKIYCG